MANIPDEANGHALPIQWQNELAAYLSDGYVIVVVRSVYSRGVVRPHRGILLGG